MFRCCRTRWQIGSRGRCNVSYISNNTTECIRNGLRSRLQPLKITSEGLQLSRRRSHCSAKQRRPASQLRFRLKSSTSTLSEKPRGKTYCNRRTLIDCTMGKYDNHHIIVLKKEAVERLKILKNARNKEDHPQKIKIMRKWANLPNLKKSFSRAQKAGGRRLKKESVQVQINSARTTFKNMPLVAAAKLLSACPQIWKSEIS